MPLSTENYIFTNICIGESLLLICIWLQLAGDNTVLNTIFLLCESTFKPWCDKVEWPMDFASNIQVLKVTDKFCSQLLTNVPNFLCCQAKWLIVIKDPVIRGNG